MFQRLVLACALVVSVGCRNSSQFNSTVSDGPPSQPSTIPVNAITKGSFTVWSVPEDPDPGEKYEIHLLVSVDDPDGNYSCRDLTGSVTGTDRYHVTIESSCRGGGFLVGAEKRGSRNKSAYHFRFNIPGAAHQVRDTLVVDSKRLMESQVMTITF